VLTWEGDLPGYPPLASPETGLQHLVVIAAGDVAINGLILVPVDSLPLRRSDFLQQHVRVRAQESPKMITIPNRRQWLIGFVLVFLLSVTRGQHFPTLNHLPSASWSVFFVAGIYLRSRLVLLFLLALTTVLDYTAITYGGISSFCISPAYILLLPGYTCLWLAGRWYARRHRFEWPTLLALAAAGLVGATLCELFTSGGFYYFSGRFAEPTFSEFGERLIRYFPSYLQSMAFYVSLAAISHLICAQFPNAETHQSAVTK